MITATVGNVGIDSSIRIGAVVATESTSHCFGFRAEAAAAAKCPQPSQSDARRSGGDGCTDWSARPPGHRPIRGKPQHPKEVQAARTDRYLGTRDGPAGPGLSLAGKPTKA